MKSRVWLKQAAFGLSAFGGGILFAFSSPVQAFSPVRFNETIEEKRPVSFPNSTTLKWDSNWDRRNDNPRSKSSRNLILIRHGQYNLNGETDSQRYLTPLGREQARQTGLRLAELNLPWTRLVNSSMTRAIETANIIEKCLPGVIREEIRSPPDDLLREGAPILPEPKISSWRPEMYWHVDGARIEAAFRKYFHRADASQDRDSYEIIVCHANVIRYFFCRALQLPPEAWLRISLKHASMTWIKIRPDGRVSTQGLGDSGHFPPENLTTS